VILLGDKTNNNSYWYRFTILLLDFFIGFPFPFPFSMRSYVMYVLSVPFLYTLTVWTLFFPFFTYIIAFIVLLVCLFFA